MSSPSLFDFLVTNGSLDPGELGRRMGEKESLERSMELLAQSPNLRALRPQILSHIFITTANPQALERLLPTLQANERPRAIAALVYNYAQKKDWSSAWHWVDALPQEHQRVGRTFVMGELAQHNPQEAIRLLLAQPENTTDFRAQLDTILRAMALTHMEQIRPLIGRLHSPQLHDMAIGAFLAQMTTISQQSSESVLELLDKQTDPAIKAWTLVRLASRAHLVKTGNLKESFVEELVPRFTMLARQNPALIPLHDEFIIERMGISSSKEVQRRYLTMLLNPATRAELTADWESGQLKVKYPARITLLSKVRDTEFNIIEPQDAARLTGMRD
ncbi:MAG: hypothetical protein QM758_07345 [Armatimonas sp.]